MRSEFEGFVFRGATLTVDVSQNLCMQPSPEAGQSDGLICGMCGKYLHVPYTLPCEHSYCLEPCLVARPNQTEVKCFRCNRLYPLGLATRNAVLERQVTKHYIEERRSFVATCNVCQHPAPALRDCQHCAVRVCSSCWDSHYVKVVTSVTESIRVLLEKKKDLEEVRNLLKARSHGEASHLRKFIEQATLVLRNACNKSLNLSTANLNNLFAEHRARLNASKGAVCNIRELIKKYAGRKQLIPLMTLDTLLDMRDALEGVSSIAKRTSEGLDACTKRPNLRVDCSLTGALDTLSLIDVAHQAESKHRRRQRAAKSKSLREPKNCSEPKSLSPPSLPSPRPLTPASPAEGRQKVFVGGISWKTTTDSLQSAFSKLGPIRKVDVYPTRGFAIVEFERPETAELVVSAHWHTVDDKRVEIRPYIPRKNAKKSSDKPKTLKEATFTGAKTGHQLVVDGLPPLPRENDIRSLFGRFGTITEVRVDENVHRAFVDFSTAEALQGALAATPPRLKGMNLRVSLPEDHEYNSDVQVKKADTPFQDSGVSDAIKWNRASVQCLSGAESETKRELEKSSDGKSKAGNSVHQDGGVPDPSTLIGDSVQNTERKEPEPESEPKKWPANGCLLQ